MRYLAIAPWLLLLAAVLDWAGLRSGRLRHPPELLAAGVVLTCIAFGLRTAQLLSGAWHGRRRPFQALSETLLAAGILLALGAGMTNWLLGLQGFVVLLEGDRVALHRGADLQHFEAGPLARLDEMDATLGLLELELVPTGLGTFYPRSQLVVQLLGEPAERLAVDRQAAGAAGPLRFYQGAFGFAPRIVLLKGEDAIFDQVVPFTSERHGPTGVAFRGSFTLDDEQLAVDGSVDLTSLDAGLKGHATLALDVRRSDGTPLGRGRLMPRRFAEIRDGYSIGFAGLNKWSEIDISRRRYGRLVLLGALLAAVGALCLPLAAWRRW